MGVHFDEKNKTFCLSTNHSEYRFRIRDNGEPEQLHWGCRLPDVNYAHLTKTNLFAGMMFAHPDPANPFYSHNGILREYPAYGNTDYRNPALSAVNAGGDAITDLKYVGYRVYEGKQRIAGLPSASAEADGTCASLEVTLCDPLIGLEVMLRYSVFDEYDVIVRSALFTNTGDKALIIGKAMSACVDFGGSAYDIVHLPGTGIQERDVVREGLARGMKVINSRKGSSSHGSNPFLALCEPGADERRGDAYGMNLVYSGDFETAVEVDELYRTRITMGINPETFTWRLDPDEQFQTPECVMTYSDTGLNQMSQNLHAFYIRHLFKYDQNKPRPVVFNHWEATIFDFNEDILTGMADAAADMGVEMFVVDDGWFGERNDDSKALGDWRVNETKFPNGLGSFIDYVHKKGMRFGLWVEPEMISPDSDLYRVHPDWCLHVPDRHRSMSRNQLVIDLCSDAVCDYLIETLSDLLECYDIAYVKWDMNRYHSESGSPALPAERQQEVSHRFVLGLYRIMEALTERFPDVLFEGCASGGGRFDPGILHYMSQIWTSDNTDPVARLRIQYGTSYAYPPVSMACHIASKTSLFTGRETSFKTKFDVAMMGNLGLEFDISKLSDDEKHEIAGYIHSYKHYRQMLHTGRYYRLIDPNRENRAAWMTVSRDGAQAVVMYCAKLKQFASPHHTLRLSGLEPDARYRIVNAQEAYVRENANPLARAFSQFMMQYTADPVLPGRQLMTTGLVIPESFGGGDFATTVWILEKTE